MIPDKYKDETDYRKIPREYLDSQIPQGRGMVKWAPFATLPEQFERIHEYILDQDKIQRPTLSEDQLNELNCKMHQALHDEQPVQMEYYQAGALHTVELHITHIDMLNMSLKGRDYHSDKPLTFSLLDITAIHFLS
ncbi:YolD-like family protein [Staphylococcus argensis]|uniref:YolD-like family protein n=1 Tax=Staphylococcus argensis TaxID=1607738 RepID=A0A2K4FCP6_9STAP|nr:YolD-like family protein [Staphylococcus argensis]MCY6992191.1 YolD-like family protein [Staphylococcus argensis]POA09138.1 YolD-like family protein [Staphylococcus argensis]